MFLKELQQTAVNYRLFSFLTCMLCDLFFLTSIALWLIGLTFNAPLCVCCYFILVQEVSAVEIRIHWMYPLWLIWL